MINIDSRKSETLQTQVYAQLRGKIESGILSTGSPLPSTRELARELSLSRNTITLAYAKLADEGYVIFLPTRGTFVNSSLPQSSIPNCEQITKKAVETPVPRNPVLFNGLRHSVTTPNRANTPIDFWPGVPDRSAFPTRTWRRILTKDFDSAGTALTEYGDAAGLLQLRQAIASHLGPHRGMRVTAAQILIVTSSQMSLNILARMFVTKDTPVVVEDPCYEGAANLFESYGARIEPVQVDQDGIRTSDLPVSGASLTYVTPSHQYPLGHAMSMERRTALLDWARATGGYIIEDDYDADFRITGSPLPSLASLDVSDSVFYLGTFSKALGPGMRVAYMVIPTSLIEEARNVKSLFDHGHSWLEQSTLAEFISSGHYQTHLRKIRHMYARRLGFLKATLRSHFGNIELFGVEAGMHVVWKLHSEAPPATVVSERARHRGVGVYPVGTCFDRVFNFKKDRERLLVLGYASVRERNIQEGIARLTRCMD